MDEEVHKERRLRWLNRALVGAAVLMVLGYLAALAASTLGPAPLEAARDRFVATGLDPADHYVAGGGYSHHLFGLRTEAWCEWARRDDEAARVTVRVSRWPFGSWQLEAIERH